MALAHRSTMPKVSQGCFLLKQTMPYGFSYFNWIAFERIREEAEGKHRNWIQFYLHFSQKLGPGASEPYWRWMFHVEEGALMPTALAATCKTVSEVAKMHSHFCKKRQDNFHLMALLHSLFGQRCLAFSSFLWCSKRAECRPEQDHHLCPFWSHSGTCHILNFNLQSVFVQKMVKIY